jgi:two-component system, NtrC family, nitrogen regulation sensor histidine kinase NtrY
MHPNPAQRRKIVLIVLLVLVPILFILGWSQASLNLKFIHPGSSEQTLTLMALSAVIFMAFMIFALILSRILLKLYFERQQQQLGSRFKTKMVVAFLGVSIVPVIFLFLFAYGLVNRTIDKWFSVPLDVIRSDSEELVRELELQAGQRADHISSYLAQSEDMIQAVENRQTPLVQRMVTQEVVADPGTVAAMCFDASGQLIAQAGDPWPDPAEFARHFPAMFNGRMPNHGLMGHWSEGEVEIFISIDPIVNRYGTRLGAVAGIMRLPPKLTRISSEIQSESQKYNELSRTRKADKRMYVSMLSLLTLLVLFIATWAALFFSKQVTIPIQALAAATHEVAQGNLGFQVVARADDELGVLVHSFNQMTQQLLENRRAIEQASLNVQQANRQLEERGNTIEAILENIPTGVVSFDPQGQITRLNSTAEHMFRQPRNQPPRVLTDLFSADDAREIAQMFRRAARQGVVSQQMDLDFGGRRGFVALTVSSVQARHGRVGSVLVLEDLAEVLRSQRSAAWQEVARRIAHEIKNPLTPIQLSTERILRLLERMKSESPAPELLTAVGDSAKLIGRELGTLKTLVDEFTAFARFPASKPEAAQINDILVDALNVFAGRLEGILLQRDLSGDLPIVQADPEQMKRVVVNLIDNAAEALEQSLRKEIWVRSTLAPDRDVVEIIVEDSGPGISPEAKERLFLPYFSTKRSGTGLGLAIVNRIITEHHGAIRVEENFPTGTKFVIELPVDRALVANSEEALES